MNRVPKEARWPITKAHSIWLLLLLACGLCVRLYFANHLFLNPDESLHYLLSVQPSWHEAYRASLTTAHPPLLILFLYFWRHVGHSEIILRLPNVIAGTIFCWLIYRWLARVANRRIAARVLPLLTFAPSLIALSAEVRQYAFMLVFMAAALCAFEYSLDHQSAFHLASFTLFLALALLSHYSAALFLLSIGLYAIVRLASSHNARLIWTVWCGGQFLLICLGYFLLKTHIEPYRKSGIPRIMADNWLRSSIYHGDSNHLLGFVGRNTTRVFAYTFSNQWVGALALALFLLSIFLLLKRVTALDLGIQPRSLAAILLAPLMIALAAAIAGIYPYGGTRHDAFLIPFLMAGTIVPLSKWHPRQGWLPYAFILIAALISNVFPNPRPSIAPADQKKSQMQAAIAILRSNPAETTIFTDYQSGLVLGYYLCDHAVVQLSPSDQTFFRSRCGNYDVISESSWVWNFSPENFPTRLSTMAKEFSMACQRITIFLTGWGVEKDDQRPLVQNSACAPSDRLGPGILICKADLPK